MRRRELRAAGRRGVGLALLAVALAACGGDGVSTAGTFDEGASTAGPFVETTAPPPGDGTATADLLRAIDQDFSPDRTLGYGPARDALYRHEQDAHGALCGLYSDFCVTLPSTGDPSTEAMALGINAEHVWPQSMGAREEPLRSDLHHLFPERAQVNTARSNDPFGEVARATGWYHRADSQSSPPRADADAWAERGEGRFEPPEARKGDVARAVFYVAAVYPEAIDPGFFPPMRADLLAWNRADPPDAAERARSAWVATLQGTENPFVRDPALADRIWGGGPVAATPVPAAPPSVSAPTTTASGPLRISEIHYDNAGEDVGEGVEVAGPPGTPLDGWRLVLVNGNGGGVYDTVTLSGALPASGAAWMATPGLQNGAPDALALVAPDGAVAEFLSYEGTVVATDGPATGLRSTDIGASEASSTPVGQSLTRTAASGWRLGPATPGR